MQPPKPPADQEEHRALAVLAQQGDRDAFDQLLKYYQQRVFGLTLMMLRNHHAAEEATQDTFIRAYTNLDLYDGRRPFYPWLATIAVRLSQNAQKRQSIHLKREKSLDDNSPPILSDKRAPIYDLMEREKASHLWDTVGQLPTGERTAIFLFYRQEMRIEEIAQTLKVTTGTVKTLLYRGRKKLRENKIVHAIKSHNEEGSP